MSKGVNNKIRKPVSFNKTKENDLKMLKFLGRRNFSGYVKKLIQADMVLREQEKDEKVAPNGTEAALLVNDAKPEGISGKGVNSTVKVETPSERLSRLNRQLESGVKGNEPKVFVNNHLHK